MPVVDTTAVNDPVVLPWLIVGLSACAALAIPLAMQLRRTVSLPLFTPYAPLCVLIVIWGIATFISEHPLHALGGSYTRYDGLETVLVGALLFTFASQLVRNAAHAQLVVKLAIYVCVLLAVQALIDLAFAPAVPVGTSDFTHSGVWRAAGMLGNPNALGAMLALSTPMAFGEALRERRRVAWASFAVTVLLLATCLLTLSRSAWVGTAVGIAIVLLRTGRDWKAARLMMSSAALGLSGVLAWPGEGAAVADRLGELADATDGSIQLRFELWRASLEMIAAHPLIGTGPASFALNVDRFVTSALLADKPHQLLLETAVNGGVLGLTAFLLLLAMVFQGLFRSGDHLAVSVLAALTAHLVVLQFNFETLPSSLVFWALAGASAGRWLRTPAYILRGLGPQLLPTFLAVVSLVVAGDAFRHLSADHLVREGVAAADDGCFRRAERLLVDASSLVPESAEYALLASWAADGAGDDATRRVSLAHAVTVGTTNATASPQLATRTADCE